MPPPSQHLLPSTDGHSCIAKALLYQLTSRTRTVTSRTEGRYKALRTPIPPLNCQGEKPSGSLGQDCLGAACGPSATKPEANCAATRPATNSALATQQARDLHLDTSKIKHLNSHFQPLRCDDIANISPPHFACQRCQSTFKNSKSRSKRVKAAVWE